MKINIINVVIFVIVLIGTCFALSIMPDVVPVHFDIHGVVDRWGSKYEMLIMPGTMLAMLVFWVGMDAWYNKSIKNHTDEKTLAEARSNQKVIRITSVITSLMFAVINGLTIFASYSQLEGFRAKKKFDRAWRECNEIRRDYLIDGALTRRFDPSFVKYLLSEEKESTARPEENRLEIEINVVGESK